MTRRTSPPPPPFDRATRDERLRSLGDERFDLAVIGAGITGSAVARDAALRGLRVALIDQGDLGGTSAPAIELLPAGHRRELRRVHPLAPHLLPCAPVAVQPGDSPNWAGRLRAALGGGRARSMPPGAVPRSGWLLRGPRLALALARSAHDAGAWVLPWLQAEGLVIQRARLQGIEVFDHLAGLAAVLRASVVVDATGIWSDRTRGLRSSHPSRVEPRRRVALALDASRGPHALRLGSGAAAIPLAGRTVIVGTAQAHDGDFDRACPSAAELHRLREELRGWCPDVQGDASGAWAGLMAEPADRVKGGAVTQDEDGLISVTAAPPALHRARAEQTLEAVAARLRREGVHVGGCLSAGVLLPGGAGLRWGAEGPEATGAGAAEAQFEASRRLPPGTAAHLMACYGGRWHEVAALAVDAPHLAEPAAPGLPLLAAQVPWALAEECVCTLPDLVRRLDLALLDARAARRLLPDLAAAADDAQGWGAPAVGRQIDLTDRWLRSLVEVLPA